MTPFGGDAIAWGCVSAALAASFAAWRVSRRGRFVMAALLLATAGIFLRANLSERHWLSDWDERYHAVVGRNAMDEPLLPRVVRVPFDEYSVRNWGQTPVWLHKPPLATWMIGASLAVFGESERAVRIPSILFAGLGILLTFLIGRRMLGAPVGLLAAGLHAWHARLAQLAAGLRATDHVDHQFTVLVELGVYAALCTSDALSRSPRGFRGWFLATLCGLVLGLALLTKSLPALVIAGVLAIALLVAAVPWAVRIAAPAYVVALGWLVQLPWQLYTERAFPEHAAYAAARNAYYFTEVVAGQGGPPWFYLTDMADVFGWLAPVAVGLFLLHVACRRELWPLAGWLGAAYGIFSLSQTKMTAYVLIAAPVVMLALAWVWVEAWRVQATVGTRWAWRALAVVLAVGFLVGSVARVHRPWRHPERRTLWAEELRYFGEQVTALGEGPWLIFNAPSRQEARFYTRETVVSRPPSADDLSRALERGFRVAIYGEPAGAPSATEGLVFIPHDPRASAHREILRQLPRPPRRREVWLWNARDPDALEEYLERTVRVDVRERIPDEADLKRVLSAEGVVAILVEPGAPDPSMPVGYAWTRVESEAFAR
ncbi:MAG: glycosyltransferase family 39 protein [Deltaproteobacteria bacterium]|nr:glycosyltransferase family 39 protein [Deltaproteobacteria bacterium]MBW2446179.1 glycosyltransferase family 39 protein [Deltaproteobacteria bacterium]